MTTKTKTTVQNLNAKRLSILKRQRTTINRLISQWDEVRNLAIPIQDAYGRHLRECRVTNRALIQQLEESK